MAVDESSSKYYTQLNRTGYSSLAFYGSVDESSTLNLIPRPEPSPLRSFDYSSIRDREGRTSERWIKISLVGCLAVAVGLVAIATVAHAAYLERTFRLQERGDILSDISADPGASTRSEDKGRTSVDDPLQFTALNFYHVRDGKPGRDYPWLKNVKLIEPHRETTLATTDPLVGYEYRWEVRAGSGSNDRNAARRSLEGDTKVVTASGAEAKVVLANLGESLIILEEVDSVGTVTRRLQERVMVKYVRREIRTLTEDEREELLDAMKELWAVKVDGGIGREKYGDDYVDIWSINRLNFRAGANLECDRFQEGLGFLVSRSLMSNTLESSLQLVNPKLSLPYWDYTIEASSATPQSFEENRPQTRSPLLQPSWFGSFDPDDYVVKDGRWAFIDIPDVEPDNPHGLLSDVYGRMRAPWDTNNRPYLTRGLGRTCGGTAGTTSPWPTCQTHKDLVTSHRDFASWVWDGMGAATAPVHAFIGGVIDCEDSYDALVDIVGEGIAREMAGSALQMRIQLYRGGVFKCIAPGEKTSVTPEKVFSAGVCGCPDYDLTVGDDYKTVLSTVENLGRLVGEFDAERQRIVAELLCNSVVNEGDQAEASHSLDPTFWPINPTLERLWQFSVLTGRVVDLSWPDSDTTVTAANGTSHTTTISRYGSACRGHRGSDVFPYGLLHSEPTSWKVQTGIRWNGSGGNTLTNRKALRALDPREDALAYVYDTFKWEHCAEDGVEFDRAWEAFRT